MSVNDFEIAHLSAEQKNKLKQFENELGCTLIAYEHKNEGHSDSGSQQSRASRA